MSQRGKTRLGTEGADGKPSRFRSVQEERRYVDDHPHHCGGKWNLTSHATTKDWMSILFVTCERCGLEGYFESDPIDRYPAGVIEDFRRKAKDDVE